MMWKKIAILVLITNSFLQAGICYTASEGWSSVTKTDNFFAEWNTKLQKKIDEVGEVAKKREDLMKEVAILHHNIERLRERNLKLIKEIKFYINKGNYQ